MHNGARHRSRSIINPFPKRPSKAVAGQELWQIGLIPDYLSLAGTATAAKAGRKGHYQPVEKCHRGIFQPRQVRSTARKTPIFIVVLTSHPCDDAAS